MDRSVGHRKDIVGLIVHLAVGYPERWLATGSDETGLISGDTEFAAGRNQFHVDELGSARPIVVIGRGERRHQHLTGDLDNQVVFEQVGGLSVDLEGIGDVQAVEIEQLTDHRVCYIRIRASRVDPDGSLRR